MTRKYSIIVVTFNNADGLQRTLKSIRQLDYANKEVIVIDGGSKDKSLSIIAENQDIITYSVSEKDKGIYNAMNKGIKLVKGDYVVFMNAGDCFAHEQVLSLVNDFNGDIILGGATYGGQVRMVKETMTLYDILSIGINHQAVYYRRETLQKYEFDESYQIIADFKSVVEPLAKDKATISCITKILAICEGDGVSQQRWRDTLTERQRMIKEVIDPFYRNDYQKFANISNDILDDFITLSRFRSLFPLLKLIARVARFLKAKFKHIPID